jgi:hypothetical protein
MRHLLDTDIDLAVEAGFIYVPLLFDPAIEREIHTPPKSHSLIELDGRPFIKTVSVRSLLENYEEIYPESYGQLKRACLERYCRAPRLKGVPISDKLRTILLYVMPYFVRRHKGLDRTRLREEDILDLIGERVTVTARHCEDATKIFDTNALRRALSNLEKQRATIDPLGDGMISAPKLREWLFHAVNLTIVDNEKALLRQALRDREQFSEAKRKHVAMLLYVSEKGSLEVDGFGFSRIGLTDEYVIYKHIGEYALRDFYGRTYLFPDCRVAVSTIAPLKPFVMERYKHPFLEGYDSRQEICMRGFNPPNLFTAAAAINALEEGINALLYGYSSRRRNGYHSLDRITKHRRTVDFEDYTLPDPTDYPVIRNRHVLHVDFDDYRIPHDHPKIASGQVEITNNYTP